MSNQIPTTLKLNSSSVGMYNAKMFGESDRAYNDMNKSIFANYGASNSSGKSASDSMDETVKTLNTVTAIGAGVGIAAQIATLVKSFIPAKKAPEGATNNAETDATKQTAGALKTALKTANKTGEWAPVQTQLGVATAKLGEVKQGVKNKESEITNIQTTQIPGQEAAIKDLDANDKELQTKSETQIGDIDKQEGTATKSFEGQIADALKADPKADPKADTSALKTQLQKVKDDAAKARTISNNNCKDAQKRNDTKRTECNATISDLKKSITSKKQEINSMNSAVPKLQEEIKDATEALAKRTVDGETPETKTETKTETPAKTSGFSNLYQYQDSKTSAVNTDDAKYKYPGISL